MPNILPPPGSLSYPSHAGAVSDHTRPGGGADAGPSRLLPPADVESIRQELADAIENFEPLPRSSSDVLQQLINFAAKKIVQTLQHYERLHYTSANSQNSQISAIDRQVEEALSAIMHPVNRRHALISNTDRQVPDALAPLAPTGPIIGEQPVSHQGQAVQSPSRGLDSRDRSSAQKRKAPEISARNNNPLQPDAASSKPTSKAIFSGSSGSDPGPGKDAESLEMVRRRTHTSATAAAGAVGAGAAGAVGGAPSCKRQ